MTKTLEKAVSILPGFLICLVIAAAGKILGSFLPAVGAASFAILIGILAGNTFLNKREFDTGTKFSESRLLEYSIVLTGATLNLSDVLSVGVGGVLFILCQMALTITFAYLIGQRLGFSRKFSLLMCAGNAVCGSSAIGSVAPVVGADSKDKGLSITIVNVTGTFLMVLMPVITGIAYRQETLHTSAAIGGILQSIGQVIASAKFVNDHVVQMATIFKIVRIIFLVLVALAFSRMNTTQEGKLFSKRRTGTGPKLNTGIPWFITGFFLFSVVNSLGLIPPAVRDAARFTSGQFEIIALAAIGMRVKFKTLISEGPKAMLYGGLVGVTQICCALCLIFLFIR